MRRTTLLYLFLFLCCFAAIGCSSLPSSGSIFGSSTVSGVSGATKGAVNTVVNPAGALSILSVVGGLSTFAGIAALVITKGAMGFRAILGGIGLCLINYAVSMYADWIFIPAIIATGIISLAFGYKTIREMLDGD